MSLERSDIQEFVSRFEERHDPYARYASFDYCYNYFHPSTGNDLLGDMEKSCLALGFYLASWGMFRGSSFMLEKSAKNFENLVGYIASQDSCAWSIDVDSYTSENIEFLLDQYNEIRTILVPQNTSHLTLVTKIMLVFLVLCQQMIAFSNRLSETFSKANVASAGLIQSHWTV